ncbi:uncharacterized protein LOC144716477 [Wolffia australiana]
MKPSSLDFSHESEEFFPVELPLSSSLQKSWSVGIGLCQKGSSSVADPDEGDDQQLTPEEESLEIGDESCPTDWKKVENQGKSASFVLTKLRSLPNLAACGSLSRTPRSRSLDNLCSLVERTEVGIAVNPFALDLQDRFRDSGERFVEAGGPDHCADVINDDDHFQSMRRIEEWVRQIDVQDGDFLNGFEEGSSSVQEESKEQPRLEPRSAGTVSADAGQRYLSALALSSTTAHMMNLGLVAIPLLGSFANLRVLDLAGNNIMRMSTGAFPRGLHVLNLSRNSIAAIEGVRELIRLRVLDLSYNRILRIGHGLGGCTALKELYLGGNKIGEVEGLHRLLKLSILDLQKNRIATTKSLGQLAANYASLQALNLDGNPILRNVGEEQLRRHLTGLLPRLIYFNKHALKPVSAKDIASHAAATAARSERHHHRHVVRRSGAERSVGRRGSRLSPLPPATGLKLLPPAGGSKNPGASLIGGRLLSGSQSINPLRRIQSAGILNGGRRS